MELASLPSFFVLLPASLVADWPKLEQKTVKVGLVARALAIFRVAKVSIYNDDDPHVKNQDAEAELIAMLLRHAETPQYLRKFLFKRDPRLRFVGLLPPLRTPHHPLADEKKEPGSIREGVVVEVNKHGSLLEIGLPELGTMNQRLRVGQRLTVKLGERLGKNRISVMQVAKGEIGEYWGFEVLTASNLTGALRSLKAGYVVGTDRLGQNLYEAIDGIRINKPASVAIAFGGPYAGLFEICERQGVDARELFDVVVNTIPEQGTATVRTEEALIATLALLNVLLRGR